MKRLGRPQGSLSSESVGLTKEQVKVCRRQMFELDMTLAELSQRSGISTSGIAKLYSQERRLNIDKVRKLLRVLKLTLEELNTVAA